MYRKERKIPTILGLFILFFGIGITVYLDQTHLLTSQAVTIPPPEEVHFTNITDNSFTVSWLTSQPSSGSVVISGSEKSQILFDDLDSDNIQRARTTHYITVKNLSEDASYSIKVISGDAKCTNPSSCQTFIQKTATKLPPSASLPPLQGKVIKSDNQPADGAIVYVSINKCLPLSGRVDSAGLWVVPLTSLRSVGPLSSPQLADSDLVQITIKLTPTLETTAVIDMKSIRQNSAFPLMIMGTSYNFIDIASKKDILANLYGQNQRALGVQTQATKTPKASSPSQEKIDILFPSSDGDTTSDNRPKFRGVGIGGKQLLITVNSTPQVDKVQIGYDGTWSWRPKEALPPGVHYISIQTYDENGNPVTINRKFIVLKSGERVVLGEATPSASLTPTSTPIVTITTSPVSPSPTPTSAPPVPTSTSAPTSPPITQPPRSGNLKPTVILFGSAATLLLLGTKLLLFP